MRLNKHSDLVGLHAYLSASSSAWLNYDDDKFDHVFQAKMAAKRGTDLHALAAELIRLRVRLPEEPITTMSMYVNDCIGWKLTPEQGLFYSRNAFGTADACGLRQSVLRISDLKTGVIEVTKPRQLEVYAAYFFLEYGMRPFDVTTELRIYQNNDVKLWIADPAELFQTMDKIKYLDKRIEALREEAE